MKDILSFPKMVASLVVQLVFFTLTEVETFLTVVVAALFGIQLGWLWGVTIFFSLYLLWRMAGGYVSLVASKIHALAVVRSKENQ